ncbi:predicted protein [Postia placenta Mad-698-R]|nr:predicted protein [Postia placenta Mad-698-R]
MSASDNVNLLAGPQLLGILFDWGLQGVLTVQILYGMAIFATVQTGLITAYAFDIYVYNNGNVASMMATHDAWFAVPVMSAMVSCTAQIYFAWRIWVLARSHILAGIIIVSMPSTALSSPGGSWFRNGDQGSFQENNAADLHALVGNGALILVDVKPYLILLSAQLFKMKTGAPRSDALINKVIRLVVETGTLTALFSIVLLTLCLALPDNLVYEAAYANTFLTNVINRAFLPAPTSVESNRSVWLSFQAAQPSTLATTPSTSLSADVPGRIGTSHGDESGDITLYELGSHKKKDISIIKGTECEVVASTV